jgi:hypothetical protein
MLPILGRRNKCTICPNTDLCDGCVNYSKQCPKCSNEINYAYFPNQKNQSGWSNDRCSKCSKDVDYCICT